MTIQIKDKAVFTALLLKQYDHNLVSIMEDLINIISEQATNIKDIVITEGWRPGGGVHSALPCRGIDLRSWIYTKEELERIETEINKLWTYDPERPSMKCVMVHDVGKGAHIHVQSHPSSIRILKKD